MPSSISPRRSLSNRSTHFWNGCRGVNFGIQNSSDMFVFLVICKERLPVIESLLVSHPNVYNRALGYLPSSLLRRIHEDRELGGFRNSPLRMLLMHPDPPCRSVQVSVTERGDRRTSCCNYRLSRRSSYLPKHHKPLHRPQHKPACPYYFHHTVPIPPV
jgi:hypothetical protein